MVPHRFPFMRFHKYHALGNDYIVLNPADFPTWKPAPTLEQIRVVCHRNFGVGSDGILYGPLPSERAPFPIVATMPASMRRGVAESIRLEVVGPTEPAGRERVAGVGPA